MSSTTSASSSPTVAIIGAGMSGLMLARVLQLHNVPCTIYESDLSANARDQGGSLDLHEKSGIAALEIAGLKEQFDKHSRPESDEIRTTGKDGVVKFVLSGLLDQPGLSVDQDKRGRDARPEIDRSLLRQLLLDSLEPDTIKWGTKLSSTGPQGSSYQFVLSDGTRHSADIVVGADGAWSSVRKALSDAEPSYVGITMVEINVSDIDSKYPELSTFVGPGTIFATDDNKGIFAQRNSGGRVRIYLFLRAPEDWIDTCGIPFSDPTAHRTQLLDLYPDWDSKLRKLIEVCDDKVIPRAMYRLPVGFTWDHKPGITLVGDAAHLMSPFAGEGANLALIDAADLGLVIGLNKSSTRDELDAAIAEFEQKICKRAAPAAEETRFNEEEGISEEGLERALRSMRNTSGLGVFLPESDL